LATAWLRDAMAYGFLYGMKTIFTIHFGHDNIGLDTLPAGKQEDYCCGKKSQK